ncbi:Hypothetical protein RAK1035_2949 [Roseovarius sp. AK1035]|nr:Hypothetical protein RAK1035_2949 [Roseovarius sp. AK1035]
MAQAGVSGQGLGPRPRHPPRHHLAQSAMPERSPFPPPLPKSNARVAA